MTLGNSISHSLNFPVLVRRQMPVSLSSQLRHAVITGRLLHAGSFPVLQPPAPAQLQPKRRSCGTWSSALAEGCSPHQHPLGDRQATRSAAVTAAAAGSLRATFPERHPARPAPPPGSAPPAPWRRPDPSRALQPLASGPRSPRRLGTVPDQPRPRVLASLSPPAPAKAGWSRGCDSLPGSLSALDSTVAMAEARVRVRAARPAGKCSSLPGCAWAASREGGTRAPASRRRCWAAHGSPSESPPHFKSRLPHLCMQTTITTS